MLPESYLPYRYSQQQNPAIILFLFSFLLGQAEGNFNRYNLSVHDFNISLDTRPSFTITCIVTINKKRPKCNSSELTSVLLFFCQFCSCSCCVRFGAELSLFCVDPFTFGPPEKSFSSSVLQSNGLQSPKSDSFKCPYLSSNKLSGLISLKHKILKINLYCTTD